MTVYVECKECGKPFRSLLPELALMKVTDHLEDEHGIDRETIIEDLQSSQNRE